MSLFHLLGLNIGPQNLHSMPFLEHLQKFYLDLFIPIYSNYPQVSCLGMNPGRGWNPNLEGSYLLEYRKYEAELWIQCKSRFYIRAMKVLDPKTSPISIYSECTKTYQF